MKFEDLAFQELVLAKKQFGEYTYHDKGADEIMDVDSLVREVKRMGARQAGESLSALATKEDTYGLMSAIILSLDEWDGFDELLEQFPELAKYY